jgi:hypothetical protein
MSLVKFKKDISSKHQLSVYDQIPSDIGLLAVWEEIPKWEIPIYLGVPVVQVQSLEHERMGGVKALSYWRDGKCMGFPPTWSRLLDAVERSEGPLIREELAAKVSTEKIWTQSVPGPVSSEMPSPEVGPVNPPSPQGPPGSTEVVQGPVTSEMPSPEVDPVNPPSPQGPPAESTDETSSMSLVKFKKDISSKHQLSVYDQIPSDIGLLAVWEEIPNWKIPIYLGVPLAQVRSLQYKEMGGLEALCLWRDGKCKGSPPPTWNSLLNAVECTEGPLIREKFEAKVSTEEIWTRETEH